MQEYNNQERMSLLPASLFPLKYLCDYCQKLCWFCQTDYTMAYINLSSQILVKYEKHCSQTFLEGSL